MIELENKKVLFLYGKSVIKDKRAYPEELMKLLNSKADDENISYEFFYYEDLVFDLASKNAKIFDVATRKDISGYDIIYHKNWGTCADLVMSCSIYLKSKNVLQLDGEAIMKGSRNKLNQYWRFWQNDVPFPRTLFASRDQYDYLISEAIPKLLDFPCVMKNVGGRRGEDNHLVNSSDEIRKIVNSSGEIRFIFQEMIKNDGDYRVFVCGDLIQLVIHRSTANGSHKNNTSLGAKATLVDIDSIPSEAREASIRAAQAFDRDIAGVDLVFDKNDKNKFYFFEVNRSPQIESSSFTDEKVEKLHGYLKKLMFDQKMQK